MDTEVYQTLVAGNPWLVDPARFPTSARHRIPANFVPRFVPAMAHWPPSRQAVLVIGARQVGKSSLLWHWCMEQKRAPLFINAEETALRQWCSSSQRALVDIRGLVAPQTPVIIDEAQHLREAGLFVKGLIDGGLENPVFVTGSSSFHLESQTRESLAGRAQRVLLHPFSLGEIGPAANSGLAPTIVAQRLRTLAERQMVVGGYPAAWLAEQPERPLAELIEAFVVRDASDRFRIAHLDAFRRLLRLIAAQSGSLVNIQEWAAVCGIARGTTNEYLDLLTKAHIVVRVAPFHAGKRAELTQRPKIYFRDAGIRNALLLRLTPLAEREDAGALLEGWVAAELVKHLSDLRPGEELRYWRSKAGAEVDFVIEQSGSLIGIECKASHLRGPQITRSSRSFIAAYQPTELWVVNFTVEAEDHVDGTRVRWVTPDWLADHPQAAQ